MAACLSELKKSMVHITIWWDHFFYILMKKHHWFRISSISAVNNSSRSGGINWNDILDHQGYKRYFKHHKITEIIKFCFIRGPWLTHRSLVSPYGVIYLGQHWFRLWLGAWWHQGITWSNVDTFSDNALTISQKNIFENNTFKMTIIFSGSNESRYILS